MSTTGTDVLIIGAGLTGLTAAVYLQRYGLKVQVVEASDGVGGRVRTDEVNGFRLDRGFQVMLSAYPECLQLLDYQPLEFRKFRSGARVYTGNRQLETIGDLFREPKAALPTLFNSVGTLQDKLLIARLRSHVMDQPMSCLWSAPETTIESYLLNFGFSTRIIDRFFRPFFGGILLDRKLQPSSRLFECLFRLFAIGDTVVPAKGMGQIPKQLADRLPADAVCLNAPVSTFDSRTVTLRSGEVRRARAVVLATDAAAYPALGLPLTSPPSRSVSCVYFRTAEPPPSHADWLHLNGTPKGLANNVSFMSAVSPDYAPDGQTLVSVAVLGLPDQELTVPLLKELEGWFGRSVRRWVHLRTYRIGYAQPALPVPDGGERPPHKIQGAYVCGDHETSPSIQGAMWSGRRTAERVYHDLSR